MNTAIIAEYNPFHKGHLYHINKTKEITKGNVIAVMSGNFVQRGEPAFINKHLRAKAALLNGVDMVLELPVEYATSSADVFAFGSCDIIKKSGIIDSVSFGCENVETDVFFKIANVLNNESENFKATLKEALSEGITYPKAREYAIGKTLNIDTSFLNSPNNILALEYIKNIINTNIKPIAIKRVISNYNSNNMTGEISSAQAIRLALKNNDESAYLSVPENTVNIIKSEKIKDLDNYSDILHFLLRTKSDLSDIADITEGLDKRIISFSKGQAISNLIEDIKTKRYTYSKIKRGILHILLDIKKSHQDMTGIKYIRVLGVRKDKINLLSELSKNSKVPVITKVSDNKKLLEKEIISTDIYNINKPVGEEYREPFIIV
ncbi:MAG: nucleotidyltransferase [Lachnospirales bacterium]